MVVLKFELGEAVVQVPFVVTGNQLAKPIIGKNVIKHLAKTHSNILPDELTNSILSLSLKNVTAIVNLICGKPLDVKQARTNSKVVVSPL